MFKTEGVNTQIYWKLLGISSPLITCLFSCPNSDRPSRGLSNQSVSSRLRWYASGTKRHALLKKNWIQDLRVSPLLRNLLGFTGSYKGDCRPQSHLCVSDINKHVVQQESRIFFFSCLMGHRSTMTHKLSCLWADKLSIIVKKRWYGSDLLWVLFKFHCISEAWQDICDQVSVNF